MNEDSEQLDPIYGLLSVHLWPEPNIEKLEEVLTKAGRTCSRSILQDVIDFYEGSDPDELPHLYALEQIIINTFPLARDWHTGHQTNLEMPKRHTDDWVDGFNEGESYGASSEKRRIVKLLRSTLSSDLRECDRDEPVNMNRLIQLIVRKVK